MPPLAPSPARINFDGAADFVDFRHLRSNFAYLIRAMEVDPRGWGRADGQA